ncbi:hypothetical protein COOONC_04224 [Cooperia oncophora]
MGFDLEKSARTSCERCIPKSCCPYGGCCGAPSLATTGLRSPIARSLLLAPSREVVHGARVGEIALVQPVAEQHYRSESCLCIALHAIPHNMLVTDVLSNFRGRHLFIPDAKAVIANVEQFLAKLKEHLGATARETVRITEITATACV